MHLEQRFKLPLLLVVMLVAVITEVIVVATPEGILEAMARVQNIQRRLTKTILNRKAI